jgi:hypothetical protein
MSAGASLAWLSELLGRLDIVHMVVGSFASSAHGLPRTTQGIDVVIDPSGEQLARMLDEFAALRPCSGSRRRGSRLGPRMPA